MAPADIVMEVADTHRLPVVRAMMLNLSAGQGVAMFADLVAAIGPDRIEYERLKIVRKYFLKNYVLIWSLFFRELFCS